jgi:hypothetical protein
VRNSAEDRATVWRVCFMLNLTSDHIAAVFLLSSINVNLEPVAFRRLPETGAIASLCIPARLDRRMRITNNVMTGDHAVHGYM